MNANNTNLDIAPGNKENILKKLQSVNLIHKAKKLMNFIDNHRPYHTQYNIFHPLSNNEKSTQNQKDKRHKLKQILYNHNICFRRSKTDNIQSFFSKEKNDSKVINKKLNIWEKRTSFPIIKKGKIEKKLLIVTIPNIQNNELNQEKSSINPMNSLKNNNERRKRLTPMERIEMELQNDLKKMKHLQKKVTKRKQRTIALSKLYEIRTYSAKGTVINNKSFKPQYNIIEDDNNNSESHQHQYTNPELLTEETYANTKSNESRAINNQSIIINKTKDKRRKKDDEYAKDSLLQNKLLTGNYVYKKNKHEMTQTKIQIKYLQSKINKTFDLLKQELDDTIYYYQTQEDLY